MLQNVRRAAITVMVMSGLALSMLLSGAPAVHAASMKAVPQQVRPLCSSYEGVSPTSQTTNVNSPISVHVQWYCESYFNVTVNLTWGDGNTDSYHCWSNCGSGSTTFNHTYTSRGYWPVGVSLADNSGGTLTYVHVTVQ